MAKVEQPFTIRLQPKTQREFLSRYLRWVKKRMERIPELKRGIVTATDAGTGTITIKFPDPTTDVAIPDVKCVGWGTITLPSVDDEVWVLHIEGGNPIAIGKVVI